MKTKGQKFLKFILIAIPVLIGISLIGLFGISYKIVTSVNQHGNPLMPEALQNPEPPVVQDFEPISREMEKKSRKDVIMSLNAAEDLESEGKLYDNPSICQIICKESLVNREVLRSDGVAYLLSFYDENQSRAFEDPVFRIALQQVMLVANMFPRAIRDLIFEIDMVDADSISPAHVATLAAKVEYHILKETTLFSSRFKKLNEKSRANNALRNLRKECDSRTPEDIQRQCLSITESRKL